MPNTVVKMPQLGESVSEGTIGRWLKQPGDRVERDEPLVEIQTDKVNAEVPSPVAGILQQILLPEGTTAAVKTDMVVIGDEMPAVGIGLATPPAAPAEPGLSMSIPRPWFSSDKTVGGGVVGQRDDEPSQSGDGSHGKRFYTPIVLRMAEEHALDLSKIEGTGAHGRVTRRDVERAIAAASEAPVLSAAAAARVPPQPVSAAA